MTITNANFDKDRFVNQVRNGFVIRENLKKALLERGEAVSTTDDLLNWKADTVAQRISQP